MLQAKSNLARYTEIEAVDNEQDTGQFVYYNPKTMQAVTIKKPSLKQALKEVARKYGLTVQDSDLALMITEDRGRDWVNVNNYRTTIKKTDEHGYETNQTIQVLHAGTVGQTYANIMNQQRRECFARYIEHTKGMYTHNGYDRVVVDREVVKDLYDIWAGDSNRQSALAIGAESKGTVRAMIAYMGYVEGMPADVINNLDMMVGSDSEGGLTDAFAQYVKQYQGINDRELEQRRALQVHQWQLKKQLLADKRADWNRMVERIFNRGLKQWDMMLKSFITRWKNWQDETKEKIVQGNKQWDERMQQLQQAKLQCFMDAQSGVSAKELHKRLTGIEAILNDMLSMMKEKYGDVITRVNVHAMLLDILKDQPELLHEEIMKMTKQKAEFGLTQMSLRGYNKAIFDDAKKVAQDFAQAQAKTQNLALLKALNDLLERCRQQIEAANENAQQAALQFVSAYNFGLDGNHYERKLPVSDIKQKIRAFKPYAFNDSLLLGTYSIPQLMSLYNNDDGVRFGVTMNVVMNQVQTRMSMMMRPDVAWGFGYYVGEFGQIEPGPRLKTKGKGEYGRITKDVYEAEKQKATEDAVCQYVDAGIAVTLSIATANPLAGAAYMSYRQFGNVATGDLSLQHWAAQTGISVAASYAGGYVGGVTQSAVYGSLATSSIQGLGNFVEYKQDGGLGLQWGTNRQWQSFGIGAATALVGARIGQAYGNTSWQKYGYTASSGYLVNRFDGHGSWKDDLIQAGASVAATAATHALMSKDGYVGRWVGTNAGAVPLERFVQGTIENAILAGINIARGSSVSEALLQQNWSKAQYTMQDYLSDYAASVAKENAKATRALMLLEKKEGLLGLAWLSLQKAGSLLGSAWGAIAEFFEKGINWIQGEGFRTGLEIVTQAALQALHRMGVEEATNAAVAEFGRQHMKDVLDNFKKDSRETTDAKIYALKQAGYDTTELEAEIQKRRQAIEEAKRAKAEKIENKDNTTQGQVAIASIESVYTMLQKGMDVLRNAIFGTSTKVDIEKGVNPDRIKELTLALNQGEKQPLEKAIQKLIDDGKLPKEVNARTMAKSACVFASLYVNLKLLGADVEDLQGFIERWYKAGAIQKDGTTYQNKIVEAYGYQLVRIEDYNKFVKLIGNGNGLQYGIMRIGKDPNDLSKGHNVNLYNYKGGWYVSDVGGRKNHGHDWRKILDKEKYFRYFQYLQK